MPKEFFRKISKEKEISCKILREEYRKIYVVLYKNDIFHITVNIDWYPNIIIYKKIIQTVAVGKPSKSSFTIKYINLVLL